MSADNWAVCPRCLRHAQAEKKAQQEAVRVKYGQVPIDEWDALRALADEPIDERKLQTFREDYEVGIDVEQGEWYLHYSGRCESCGLTHNDDRTVVLLGVCA